MSRLTLTLIGLLALIVGAVLEDLHTHPQVSTVLCVIGVCLIFDVFGIAD